MRRRIFTTIIVSICMSAFFPYGQASNTPGTINNPVMDSSMTWTEAVSGRTEQTPPEIMKNLLLIDVLYHGFDGMIHRGQLVVDRRLADDLGQAFALALKEKFPVQSMVPLSHPAFGWSDARSMAANNTSAFNYRKVTGGKGLSRHAYGQAIDINPAQNPYLKGDRASPTGAVYTPSVPGTLTPESPIVRELKKRGWKWGGDYRGLKDYQHLEKKLP